MPSGRVIRKITLTCNPSDVEFNLVAETEGCQLTYLYQQFKNSERVCVQRQQDMLSVRQRTRAFSDMFRTHHHLHEKERLAQQDAVSEFSFLTDNNV